MTDRDVSSGCLLPFAQAVVTGLLVALAVGFLAALIMVDSTEGKRVFFFGGLGFSLAGLMAWMTGLSAWRKAAYPPEYYEYEAPTSTNQEAIEPAKVRVEITQENGRNMQFVDLPCTLDQLKALARGLLEGQTLSESAWTGSNSLFTRAEFSALRAELIKRGLAEWNNPSTPARGVKLTRGGRAAMRTFASEVTQEKGFRQ